VQQYVKGEAESTDYAYSSVGPSADEVEEPEAPVHITEPSLTDKTDLAESLQTEQVEKRRRYYVDWDPLQ